jgi:hypothetical protein
MKTPSKTKWQDALEVVTREIESGVFPPQSPFYTIKQLCERFGCSNITASRVFDKLKTRGLLRTNGRQGAFVMAGVKRETVYLALQTDLVDAGSSSRFLCAVMEGFQRQPLAAAFRVKPVSLDFCLAHPDAFVDAPMIVLQGAMFEVYGNSLARLNRQRADAVRERFNPVVFQTCIALPEFTEVGCDMRGAIAAMVGLLHDQGHRRIAYLGGDAASLWFRSRFDGYLDGLQRQELPFDPTLVGLTDGIDANADDAVMERLLALTEPPTAVVCANELRALNVLSFCRKRDIRVPEALSVTAFGNSPETALSTPALTTHDPCDADMGYAALDLLQKRRQGRLKEPVTVMIQPKLVKRASHGRRIVSQ